MPHALDTMSHLFTTTPDTSYHIAAISASGLSLALINNTPPITQPINITSPRSSSKNGDYNQQSTADIFYSIFPLTPLITTQLPQHVSHNRPLQETLANRSAHFLQHIGPLPQFHMTDGSFAITPLLDSHQSLRPCHWFSRLLPPIPSHC